MIGSNPLKSVFRLISFESVFQTSQPKSKYATQEMRQVALSEDEILEFSLAKKHRRTQIRQQFERLAEHHID